MSPLHHDGAGSGFFVAAPRCTGEVFVYFRSGLVLLASVQLVACGGDEQVWDTANGEINPDAPVVNEVVITPSEGANNSSVLACEASASDPAGDSISYSYIWESGGEELGSGSEIALEGSGVRPLDEVRCVALAENSEGDVGRGSAAVVLENRAPEVLWVSIESDMDAVVVGSTLTCSDESVDPDGEVVTRTYEWSSGGDVLGEGQLLTLTEENTASWIIYCTVTAEDGFGGIGKANREVEVSNTPPTIASVRLDPPEFAEGDAVTCIAEDVFDADNHLVQVTYNWFVDGDYAGLSATTINGQHFDKGQVVECQAIPTDEVEDGEAVWSDAVTVSNTAPTAPTVELSSESPEARREGIVCEVTVESTDIDSADELTYIFDWSVDGVAWSGDTSTTTYAGDTISGDDTYVDEEWECSVSVSDGDATVAGNSVSGTVVTPISWSSTVDVSADGLTIYGANLYDAAGTEVTGIGDYDGDGFDDIAVAAPSDDSGAKSGGRIYLFSGVGLSQTGTLDIETADHIITGEEAYAYAGSSLAPAGDVDGDGYADFLIGAYGDSSTKDDGGEAYLFLGGNLGSTKYIDLEDADYTFVWDYADAYLGLDVAGGGDVDGDGYDDILISAPRVDCQGDDDGEGCVFLIYGSSIGWNSRIDMDDSDVKFSGRARDSRLGGSIAIDGDFDGDGYDDILIGAEDAGTMVDESGAVYLILASTLGSSGAFSMDDADYIISGAGRDDLLGYAVDFAGDVDGDGLDDLVLGAPRYEYSNSLDSGAAGVFLASSITSSSIDFEDADYILGGSSSGALAGCSVAGVGDMDGDGLDDVLVGSVSHNGLGNTEGGAFVFLSSTLYASYRSTSTADFEILGGDMYDYAGGSVAGAGDVNGDGVADILVGVKGGDLGGYGAGEAYLLIP